METSTLTRVAGKRVVRIFVHPDAPAPDDTLQHVALAGRDVEVVVVDTAVAPHEAMSAGVIGLPAVIVEHDGREVGRRECFQSARGLRRWLRRRLALLR